MANGIVEFKQKVLKQSQEIEAYCQIGYFYHLQGQQNSATRAARKAIVLDPNCAIAYFSLGLILGKQEKLELAIACFQKAIALRPYWEEALHDLGKALYELERFEEAIATLQKLLQINPTHASARLVLGNCRSETCQPEKAIQELKTAIELEKDWVSPYYNLGKVLENQGRWEEAIFYLQQAVTLQPDLMANHLALAKAYENMGRFSRSLNCYQKILEIEKDNFAAKLRIFLTHSKQGFFKEAILALQEIKRSHPKKMQGFLENSGYKNILEGKDDLLISERPSIVREVISYREIQLNISIAFPVEKACIPAAKKISRNRDRLLEINGEFPEHFVASLKKGYAFNYGHASIAATSENDILQEATTGEHHVAIVSCLSHISELKYMEGTVALLACLAGGFNYYHWFVDLLPRIELILRAGFSLDSIDWFLLHECDRPFQQETLAILEIPKEKIITTEAFPHIQADRLLVSSIPSSIPSNLLGYIQGTPQWVCNFLRDRFLPLAKPISRQKAYEKIYISRRRARHRQVKNEREVMNTLESLGFVSICLESFSFREQISLLAGAKVVVAPHGAGLTNVVFCRPGTKIIEIFPASYIPNCYQIIANLTNLEYYALICDETIPLKNAKLPIYRDISVPLDRLREILDMAEIR